MLKEAFKKSHDEASMADSRETNKKYSVFLYLEENK